MKKTQILTILSKRPTSRDELVEQLQSTPKSIKSNIAFLRQDGFQIDLVKGRYNLKTKWRGIKTNPNPKNEDEAITITNRLGQKSISLPRIDDKKRWAGFPGLAGTAKKIAKIIPFCTTYVEPFAGSAKVYQEFKKRGDWNFENVYLNDYSFFVAKWLHKEFPETWVTQLDFTKIMKSRDSKNTFFLIDPPWVKSYYDQKFAMFNREKVRDYDEEVLELCRSLKGKFIITSRKENKTFKSSEFNHKLVRSVYVVSGKFPQVLLTTNLPKEDLKIK